MPGKHRMRTLSAAAGAVVAALALAGCAAGSADTTPTPDDAAASLPADASLQEWQAAFETVDPISLTGQAPGPEGDMQNAAREAFAAYLEEYSGGKITVDLSYSYALVSSSTEWLAAYGDGRLDFGNFHPYYNPDVVPMYASLSDATFLDGNLPISQIASPLWLTDVSQRLPEYRQEADDAGIHVIGAVGSGSIAAIFCTSPRSSLDDFAGQAVTASGAGRVAQVSALGAAPTSIAFTELYEALQRKAVACGSTTPTAIDSLGAESLVPYAVLDPEAALTNFPVFFAVGKEKWDSIPLLAQQLITDAFVNAYNPTELKTTSTRNGDWAAAALDAGGAILELDADARRAVLDTNAVLLGKIAESGADTDAFVEARDTWLSAAEGLFPGLTADLAEFLPRGGFATLDLQPFVDAYAELVSGTRPR